MTKLTLSLIFVVSVVLSQTSADDPERIIGGVNAYPGQLPYQVSLKLQGEHLCGGTLITPRHVVTAAHCIRGLAPPPYSTLTVITGSISLSTGGQIHHVADATYHPNYQPTAAQSFRNDIAVLTLADTVTETNFQSPISFATHDPPANATVIMSGWGKISNPGPLADILQTATVKLLSREQCEKDTPVRIYNGQICAIKQKGVGACMGDSGGPLVYNNELIGVVSFVFPCAEGFPDVFTRVSQYTSFINEIISRK